MTDNKLSLHLGKTEYMLFGSAGNFQVICDGTAIVSVSTVKYLGVTLDASLSGISHVNKMLKARMGRLAFCIETHLCWIENPERFFAQP